MEIGTGFFISLGCGLGIALGGGPVIGVYTIFSAAALAIANIIFKSDNFKDYKAMLIKHSSWQWRSIPSYLALQFLTTTVIISITIITVVVRN